MSTFIKEFATGLIGPVTGLISEFIVDKDKAAELAFQISKLAGDRAHEVSLAQIAVNQAEASSDSLFKGGWRPATGWCCVFAMAFNFIVIPLFGPMLEAYTEVNMVPLDLDVMLPVLMGMLGLGALRTLEKTKDVAAN